MLDYRQLLARTDAPAGSSWGLFGPGDELGTLNFLTPECATRAASLVRRGAVFNLDHALDAFDPPVARHRHQPRHVIFSNGSDHRDDHLDGLYLQGSSQIDGLRHFRHPDHGFYNGVPDAAVGPGSPAIGINRFAERGIVGRGVLVDVDRHLRRHGRALDHRAGEAFPASLLDAAAAEQGVAFEPGDILLLRTGWLDFYFNRMSADERRALPGNLRSPGLLQAHETLAWLWDHRVALAASDNAGLEAIPAVAGSPFIPTRERAAGVDPIHSGLMHPTMIALLGLAIGELWDLEALAADCAATGVWEFMVVAKPLNVTGGVGSPANAVAIK
ncbi:cyclase family protein [Arenibaculum sp.]|uniref:cyclase family protein n=1 Tax=Arenibaculum sp. TaxID=2865862 RepID=UPI002E12D005|nr:cyclase family protein [Arenibaculum sp.]